MSEASETIWARPHPYEPDWTDDEDLATTGHTKYRRADLPATDEHAFANEKVKALQHSLGQLLQVQDGLPMMGIEATRRSDQARAEAAEARIEELEAKQADLVRAGVLAAAGMSNVELLADSPKTIAAIVAQVMEKDNG